MGASCSIGPMRDQMGILGLEVPLHVVQSRYLKFLAGNPMSIMLLDRQDFCRTFGLRGDEQDPDMQQLFDRFDQQKIGRASAIDIFGPMALLSDGQLIQKLEFIVGLLDHEKRRTYNESELWLLFRGVSRGVCIYKDVRLPPKDNLSRLARGAIHYGRKTGQDLPSEDISFNILARYVLENPELRHYLEGLISAKGEDVKKLLERWRDCLTSVTTLEDQIQQLVRQKEELALAQQRLAKAFERRDSEDEQELQALKARDLEQQHKKVRRKRLGVMIYERQQREKKVSTKDEAARQAMQEIEGSVKRLKELLGRFRSRHDEGDPLGIYDLEDLIEAATNGVLALTDLEARSVLEGFPVDQFGSYPVDELCIWLRSRLVEQHNLDLLGVRNLDSLTRHLQELQRQCLKAMERVHREVTCRKHRNGWNLAQVKSSKSLSAPSGELESESLAKIVMSILVGSPKETVLNSFTLELLHTSPSGNSSATTPAPLASWNRRQKVLAQTILPEGARFAMWIDIELEEALEDTVVDDTETLLNEIFRDVYVQKHLGPLFQDIEDIEPFFASVSGRPGSRRVFQHNAKLARIYPEQDGSSSTSSHLLRIMLFSYNDLIQSILSVWGDELATSLPRFTVTLESLKPWTMLLEEVLQNFVDGQQLYVEPGVLTKTGEAAVQKIFSIYDKDCDGALAYKEILQFQTDLGRDPFANPADYKAAMVELGCKVDSSGFLTLEGLQDLYATDGGLHADLRVLGIDSPESLFIGKLGVVATLRSCLARRLADQWCDRGLDMDRGLKITSLIGFLSKEIFVELQGATLKEVVARHLLPGWMSSTSRVGRYFSRVLKTKAAVWEEVHRLATLSNEDIQVLQSLSANTATKLGDGPAVEYQAFCQKLVRLQSYLGHFRGVLTINAGTSESTLRGSFQPLLEIKKVMTVLDQFGERWELLGKQRRSRMKGLFSKESAATLQSNKLS